MYKPLTLVAHDSVTKLKSILAHTRDEGCKKRIHAILRVREGQPHGKIARELGACRTSLCTWITRYNSGGHAALVTNYGGRPKGNLKWDTSLFTDLATEIDKGGYWSIPRMQEWLRIHTKNEIPEQTVWYRMDKLKYSYKSGRPSPVQGSVEKQEAFKKGALSHSWSR